MAAKKEKELVFEERIERLKEIVFSLEQGKTGLEQSIALFKEGLLHTQKCREELDKAQHEIRILSQGQWEEYSADLKSTEDHLAELSTNTFD